MSTTPTENKLSLRERDALYERAKAWRSESIEYFESYGKDAANIERLQWLRGMEGDDLMEAYLLYQAVKERDDLYQEAAEWRDRLLRAGLEPTDWLKSLAGMGRKELIAEYQQHCEIVRTAEEFQSKESPEAAGEQEKEG